MKDNKVKSPTARMFAEMIERHHEFNQFEIATQLGLGSNGNMITQIKMGRTRLPIKYIDSLCAMLGEESAPLLQTALEEYNPETVAAIGKLNGLAINKDEQKLIDLYRKAQSKVIEEWQSEAAQKVVSEAIAKGEAPSERKVRVAKSIQARLTDNPAILNKFMKLVPSMLEEA